MNKKRSVRQFLWGFVPALAVIALQEGISVFGVEIQFLRAIIHCKADNMNQFLDDFRKMVSNATFNVTILLVYSIAGVILFGWWFRSKRRDLSWRSMSLKGFKRETLIPGILLFTIGSQLVCTFVTDALSVLYPEWLAVYESMMKSSGFGTDSVNPWVVVATILYGCIIGPVTEELVFRGLTLGYMKKSSKFFTANVLQALLFAGFHMNMLQASYAFLLGLMLGYIAYRTGSVMVTILLHIGFNASSFLLGGVFEAATRQGALLSAVILVGAMMLVYFSIPLLVASKPIAKEK
ncbi:MAG: CPBP family intramembrane metalloprotease [Lachnospiraceae bacterium]|nr:CPBP family intramembrane metalloprotease [Lachnospiraceae bacterium]